MYMTLMLLLNCVFSCNDLPEMTRGFPWMNHVGVNKKNPDSDRHHARIDSCYSNIYKM